VREYYTDNTNICNKPYRGKKKWFVRNMLIIRTQRRWFIYEWARDVFIKRNYYGRSK
jgi:hypothetical protein